MSEEAAFLAAIAADPGDDTARLIYADWLADHDDPRAEYVRLEARRHSLGPRQKKERSELSAALEVLRPQAAPDWLARIDRVTRFSMYWPQDVCRAAERDGLIGRPLASVHSRGNKSTRLPRAMQPGHYLYVFAFRQLALFLVGRVRIEQLPEVRIQTGSAAWSYVDGVSGSEGTAVRLDLVVPKVALRRLSWYSGKDERRANLDAEGRLISHESFAGVIRLTPSTAADLDALLRGDPVPE